MPKNKYLNDIEKAQINVYKGEGCSNREIGRKIGRSEKVIRHFLKDTTNYGKKCRTKGNQKLTIRQKNAIKKEATTKFFNCTQIKKNLSLPVTSKHIGHILRNMNDVKWRKPKTKPLLLKQHKTARLQFARKHMGWTAEWDRVIFSDEKKFNLDGPDSYSAYWHDLRKNTVRMSKRNFGGGSVMVWAAFSASGKSPICFVPTKMNSNVYTDLLEDALIPFLEEKMDDDSVFQQDNAPIHVSKHSVEWFKDRNIPLLEFPARSPDLNPIENLWGCLARRVYNEKPQGHVFKTTLELKNKIKEEWAKLEQQTLKNLINSMPNRLYEVISHNGGPTKY